MAGDALSGFAAKSRSLAIQFKVISDPTPDSITARRRSPKLSEGGSDSPPKRPKDRFQSDPQHLTASVSPGREVVDTAFGALNSCGRTEEVYPPIRQGQTAPAEDAGFWGESTTPPAAKPLTQPTPQYGRYTTQ